MPLVIVAIRGALGNSDTRRMTIDKRTPQQGFPTGKPHGGDAEFSEDPDQTYQFVMNEHFW